MRFTWEAIDHVQLAAPTGEENAARKFFTGILGFTEVEKPPLLKAQGGVWFQTGGIQLHIGADEEFVPSIKAHPAFQVKHLEGLKRHLDKERVAYQEDSRLPGAKRIYVMDPFGNRMEFLEWE
ncbi:VOC family protein [Lentibacillus sediminis]|uniref:VOC family protein n=1 Tax=Lentibacillus sediminis TaxID=1940529 RepID=UPI000C1C51E6|nr:VOC family protein [Lentibacillus sediminis]